MSRIHDALTRGRLLGLAIFAGMLTTFAPAMEIRAQGMPNMKQMEGMGDTKQTAASATGTVTAVNAANHKITVNHGPIPEIKWPAMIVYELPEPLRVKRTLSPTLTFERSRDDTTGNSIQCSRSAQPPRPTAWQSNATSPASRWT
jgi:hypothetical protein